MRSCVLPILLAGVLLAACAASSREGRVRVVAPIEVSRVYSGVDMQVKLVTSTDAASELRAGGCPRSACDTPALFERRVLRLGAQLAQAAYRLYPELRSRGVRFEFGVAAKADAGTLSNAGGQVLVLDGVRRLGLNDEALSFVIAREMGHVIGRHHDEDSATGILISAVVGLVVPVANFFRGLVAALPGGTAVSAAATAASWAGTSMVRASYRADQVREADAIALTLSAAEGAEPHEFAEAFAGLGVGEDPWLQDLRASARRLDLLAWGPPRRLQGALTPVSAAAGISPSLK